MLGKLSCKKKTTIRFYEELRQKKKKKKAHDLFAELHQQIGGQFLIIGKYY